MILGKVVEKHVIDGKEVIFRYPKANDTNGFLKHINSLVNEKAYIGTQTKFTKKKEVEWLETRLKAIKKKRLIVIVVEINGKLEGATEVGRYKAKFVKHRATFGVSLNKKIRGIGIGKLLAQCVIKEAKKLPGLKIITLNAMGSNKKAQALYIKLGFNVIGTIKKGIYHYGKYLDDIQMVKYLK